MGVDTLSIDVCVALFVCLAVREVRLGELFLQIHVIFRKQAFVSSDRRHGSFFLFVITRRGSMNKEEGNKFKADYVISFDL